MNDRDKFLMKKIKKFLQLALRELRKRKHMWECMQGFMKKGFHTSNLPKSTNVIHTKI